MTSKLMGKQWKESSVWSQPKMLLDSPLSILTHFFQGLLLSPPSIYPYSECCLCASNSARFHGTACLNQELKWFLQWVSLVVRHLQYDRCASQRQQELLRWNEVSRSPHTTSLHNALKDEARCLSAPKQNLCLPAISKAAFVQLHVKTITPKIFQLKKSSFWSLKISL